MAKIVSLVIFTDKNTTCVGSMYFVFESMHLCFLQINTDQHTCYWHIKYGKRKLNSTYLTLGSRCICTDQCLYMNKSLNYGGRVTDDKLFF